MDHDLMKERLGEFLDGEMSPEEGRAFSGHLAACAECRALRAEWERLRGVFFAAGPAPAAEETERFVARVMARLPEPEAAGAPSSLPEFRWLVPALGLSFAALALSFAPLLEQPEDPPSALLLEDSRSPEVARWMSSPEAETPDEALGFAAEER